MTKTKRCGYGRLLIGLCACVGLVLSLGLTQGQACTVLQTDPCPECVPGWWAKADAQVVFDSVPDMGRSGEGTAERLSPGGAFSYSWETMSFFDTDYLILNLENEENASLTKHFWVSYHFNGTLPTDASLLGGTSGLLGITGYYETLISENDQSLAFTSTDFGVLEVEHGKCAWVEATMWPQPARESFLLVVGKDDFSVDHLKLGTKCVPLPSTLLLLGGGLVGLIGFKRRKKR